MIRGGKQSSRLGQLWRECRGQTMLEFALSLPFVVLMVVGGFAIGISLERHLTVGQLVRHTGNMYARDVDFDDINSPARHLVVQSGGNLRLSTAKGDCDSDVKSVMYLTQVQITPDEPPGTFANEGQPVMLHRTMVGNACLGDSSIGTPSTTIWDPNDPVNPGVVNNAFDEADALATLPNEVVSKMIPGETVFVVEVLHQPNDLLFPGFLSPESLYTRGFF